MKMPATVNGPIRQRFGMGEGRTSLMVKDILRKSPVITMMTITIPI
jgi:hypothetical protein